MVTANERFKYLAESWFLSEPAFFAMFCSHAHIPNPNLKCAVRVGQCRMEYNPELISAMPDEMFEETIKIEMIRLFLKHPYERTPAVCPREKMRIASDIVLTSNYRFNYQPYMASAEMFDLPSDKHYEWYLGNLPNYEDVVECGQENNGEKQCGDEAAAESDEESDAENFDNGNSSSEGAKDNDGHDSEALAESAGLWEEDECKKIDIDNTIEKIKDWGTVPRNLADTIIASTQARIDYRKVLSGFRASVLSSKRSLTRMRPNRRSGFEHMGSKRDFSTRLLIAVDVSGSVTNETLGNFFSIIVRFFKYGIEEMDVIQFDTEIKGEILSLEKVRKGTKFEINGRGGTNFQSVFNFIAEHRDYDGLIIFTDGYAPEPKVKPGDRTRKVWVCEGETSYNKHHEWMLKSGRACFLNL